MMYIVRARCNYTEGCVRMNDNFIVNMNKEKFSRQELQDKITATYEGVDGMTDIQVVAISAVIKDY